MSEWQTDETITADKLNRKEAYVGTSAPSNPTDGQLWVDTSQNPPVLKIYDATNSAWKLCITNITQIESRSHADLQNIGENDHHPKIHGHSEHSFGEAEVVANKNQPNGYAGLDASGLIPWGQVEASDTLRHSNDTARSTNSTEFTKMKEIKVNKGIRGTIRVKFDLRSASSLDTAEARIYKNGSPVGTTRSTNETAYQTYTEDLNLILDAGDKLQIYGRISSAAGHCYVRNFRLYYDLAIPNDFTNQDP